jgi:hypothetical protein
MKNQQRKRVDHLVPVVLVATPNLEADAWNRDPARESLDGGFEVRVVPSPDLALDVSREVKSDGGEVALFLSDMLSDGNEVIDFISAFSQDWPRADIHIFDAVEGRVIFSEPREPGNDRPAGIRIESNGNETIEPGLVLRMVKHYFPGSVSDERP